MFVKRNLSNRMDELLPILEKENISMNLQAHPFDFIERNDEALRMIRALINHGLTWFSLQHIHSSMMMELVILKQCSTMRGIDLTHVLFADTFNHKAANGLRYIVNPPGVEATVHQHLNIR